MAKKVISNKNMYKMANDIVKSVNNDNELPTSLKYDNVTYTQAEFAWIGCYGIYHLGSSFEIPTCSAAQDPKGDTIFEKISKADYKKMALNLHNYIKKNRKLPNYITTISSKKKLNIKQFTVNLMKILNYAKNNNLELPGAVTVDTKDLVKQCKSPFVSSPHYTSQGCNKLGQCTSYDCGPHSVHQILKKFGVTNITEQQLMSWMGTTSSGTSHAGIESGIAKAAKAAGIKLKVEWKNFSDFGNTVAERMENIGKLICQKNIGVLWHILYSGDGSYIGTKGCGHYETLDKINTKTKYCRALNSLGSRCNYPAYCGHLQDRAFSVQAAYVSGISQKSICIITKV